MTAAAAAAPANAAQRPKAAPRRSERVALMAFVGDDISRAAVTEAAKRQGCPGAKVESGSIDDAVKRLSRIPTPSRLIVDVSTAADPMSALESLSQVCDEGTRVVVLGTVNDVNLYRTLVNAGIDDYLVKPASADDIAAVLKRLDEPADVAKSESEIGRLVTVVGTRGGVGATTTAVNLAWVFAHEYGLRTALVDLDLHFGTCDLAFDMSASSGLRELLANAARIDELFVERAMLKVSDQLSVLAPDGDMAEAQGFDMEAFRLLIETLRKQFPMVVIDLPRFAVRTQAGMLAPPLAVTLVTDPSLSGLRDAVKLHGWFEKLAPGADMLVAMNRVGASRNAELERRDFESNAGFKLACQVPLDAKATAAATVEAKPVVKVSPRCGASKAFQAMAAQLAGPAAKPTHVPAWQRLLRKR